MVTHGGFRAVLNSTAVDGHPFANHIVIADHQARRLTLVLKVRGVFTDRGKLKDTVVLADAGRAFEHNMRADNGALPDFDIRANDRPRADLDASASLADGSIMARGSIEFIGSVPRR